MTGRSLRDDGSAGFLAFNAAPASSVHSEGRDGPTVMLNEVKHLLYWLEHTSIEVGVGLIRATRRMQAVQTPVIPVVADLIRRHPGTISLGQGVVHFGPPPQA